MKRCPACNRTFTDKSLSFCIEDGSRLVRDESASGLDSQATAVFPDPPPTVQMPPPRATGHVAGPFPNAPPRPQPYGWANESPPAWIPPPPPPRPANQQQTLAIVSLILGLLSITFGWICGGPVLSFFAVLLGAIALAQIKSNPVQYAGKVPALVGLITGGIVLLFTLAMLIFWIIMIIIAAVSR